MRCRVRGIKTCDQDPTKRLKKMIEMYRPDLDLQTILDQTSTKAASLYQKTLESTGKELLKNHEKITAQQEGFHRKTAGQSDHIERKRPSSFEELLRLNKKVRSENQAAAKELKILKSEVFKAKSENFELMKQIDAISRWHELSSPEGGSSQ